MDDSADQAVHGTILVIDDEDGVVNLLARLFKRQGFRTITASDGLEGIRQFEAHKDEIDLVFLDLTMPDYDGVETRKRLAEAGCDKPVYLITGYGPDSVDQPEAFAGFIQKPLELNVIKAVLEKFIP